MMMELYKKLKEKDLVDDHKDFTELIWLRAIKINDNIISDPNHEIKDGDRVKVGILPVD